MNKASKSLEAISKHCSYAINSLDEKATSKKRILILLIKTFRNDRIVKEDKDEDELEIVEALVTDMADAKSLKIGTPANACVSNVNAHHQKVVF